MNKDYVPLLEDLYELYISNNSNDKISLIELSSRYRNVFIKHGHVKLASYSHLMEILYLRRDIKGQENHPYSINNVKMLREALIRWYQSYQLNDPNNSLLSLILWHQFEKAVIILHSESASPVSDSTFPNITTSSSFINSSMKESSQIILERLIAYPSMAQQKLYGESIIDDWIHVNRSIEYRNWSEEHGKVFKFLCREELKISNPLDQIIYHLWMKDSLPFPSFIDITFDPVLNSCFKRQVPPQLVDWSNSENPECELDFISSLSLYAHYMDIFHRWRFMGNENYERALLEYSKWILKQQKSKTSIKEDYEKIEGEDERNSTLSIITMALNYVPDEGELKQVILDHLMDNPFAFLNYVMEYINDWTPELSIFLAREILKAGQEEKDWERRGKLYNDAIKYAIKYDQYLVNEIVDQFIKGNEISLLVDPTESQNDKMEEEGKIYCNSRLKMIKLFKNGDLRELLKMKCNEPGSVPCIFYPFIEKLAMNIEINDVDTLRELLLILMERDDLESITPLKRKLAIAALEICNF